MTQDSYDFKPSEPKASALKSSVEAPPRPSRVPERQPAPLTKKHSFDEDEDTFSSPFIELTHQFEPKTTAAPSPAVREKSDRLSARAAKYKHHKTSSQQRDTSTTPSTSSTMQPPSPQRSYSVGSLQHLYSLYEQHKARRSTRKSSTDNTKKSSASGVQNNPALSLSLNATALVSPRNVLATSLTTPPVSRRRLRRSRRSDSQTGSWDKKDPLSSSLGGMTTSSDEESVVLSASSGASSARHHRRSSSSYSAGKEMIIHGHSRHHSRHYSRDNSAVTPKPVNDSATATHDSNHKSPQIGGIPSQVVFICGTLLLVFVVMFCYRMIVNSKVMLIQR